jgi:hypothetical protein
MAVTTKDLRIADRRIGPAVGRVAIKAKTKTS